MTTETFSEDWNFYFCHIDDKPHSTMVNLSLFNVAPIPELNQFHALEVTLRYPSQEHGMTTDKEFAVLSEMGDLIDNSQTQHLRYVARQTGDGKRKFYFYATADTDFSSVIDKVSQAFPAYRMETFRFEDTGWETYFDNLYPNAIAWNEITNRAVRDRLEDSDDNLDIPREIDHTIIFQDHSQAVQFSKVAKEKGFTTQISTRTEGTSSGTISRTHEVLAQKVDAPAKLDPITFELENLANRFGGSYDGWGCYTATD